MIINKKYLENGVTPGILEQFIRVHERQRERYHKLKQYYLGNQNILSRTKESSGVANNRIVVNHAKYITKMSVAYFLGVPVAYSAFNGYDIEEVKKVYFEQDIADVDYRLAKERSICGRAVEMVYANEKAEPCSCMLPVENAFVVYDDTVEASKLLGVYYYREIRLDGNAGDYIVFCADASSVRKYRGGSLGGLVLEEETAHYFGFVPFIEYPNNEEQQGDYEQEIGLIDAYNTLMSDRVNDKEQFVDSFLLLLGIDISGEQAKELKKEKILCGEIGGSAEYLSKLLNEADTEILRKAIKEDIHEMSMVPDLTNEQFAGNLSGVAIKYKILGFDQDIRNKENSFRKGLKERLALYMHFLNLKRNTPVVPLHKIRIEFSRNLPANELEISQMINNLSGTVSDETLISRLPFVHDAKEEVAHAEQERIKKQEATRDVMDRYVSPIRTKHDEK